MPQSSQEEKGSEPGTVVDADTFKEGTGVTDCGHGRTGDAGAVEGEKVELGECGERGEVGDAATVTQAHTTKIRARGAQRREVCT